jgi:hypothetical protein
LYRYGLKNGGIHRVSSHRHGSSHRIGAGVDHGDRVRTGVDDISLRAIGRDHNIGWNKSYCYRGNDGVSRGTDHRHAASAGIGDVGGGAVGGVMAMLTGSAPTLILLTTLLVAVSITENVFRTANTG